MSVRRVTPRLLYEIHPDGDFVEQIYLRTADAAALDLAGKELVAHLWVPGAGSPFLTLVSGTPHASGSSLTIGSAGTIPVLPGQAALGQGTLCTLLLTEALIQEHRPSRGGWEMTLTLRDSDDSDPDVLYSAGLTFQGGRPR